MIWIGQFKENYNDERYPSILAAIHDEPPENKAKILRHLKNGFPAAMAPGYLYDKIDGSTLIPNPTCYHDGTYAWRSDLIYYYEKYNVDLPEDFIKHALKNS